MANIISGSIPTTQALDDSSLLANHGSKTLVEEGYDHIAPRYLEWATSHSSPRLQYLQKLLELLSEKSKVLELGCMSLQTPFSSHAWRGSGL